ncbi:MAG: MFS transporter [Spirochaetes bacterium]|nr:MFS transporter [Spirochaetota bacterium]
MKEKKVTIPTIIAYGSGDLYGGGSFILIGMLYMFFLTEVAGLPPALAGLVFAIGKVWDAFSDPLMGYISDHTKSSFGRRRIYFLIGIIPIPISFILLWLPVHFQHNITLFIYYSLAYVLFNTVFTMMMVPYAALNAELTHDFKIRTRLSGARMIFSQISALLGGTIPKMIIHHYSDNPHKGHMMMAIGFGFLYALPWLFVFFSTWELPVEIRANGRHSFKKVVTNFTSILKNKSFRIHIGMYICAYSAMDILMALFAYYLTYYLQMPEKFSLAMGAMLFTQVLMLTIYVYISNRKGKGFTYILGLTIWGCGMILSLFLNSSSSPFLLIFNCILIGAGLSAGVMIPWAILPSVTDVDELITTKKRAGVYSGAMTLIRKLVQGVIAMPFVGVILQLIGYQQGQEQSLTTLRGLKFFFMSGPLIMIGLGIFCAFFFKIKPKNHQVMIDEITRLKNGGLRSEVTSETKAVCEQLTGIPYEKLYQ